MIMGAAGYVTVYDYEMVVEYYHRYYPEHNLFEDWWYLKQLPDNPRLVVTLADKLYILDYADDQGQHEGTNSEFGFKDGPAHERVKYVLRECRLDRTEVWT